jgi:peroxiredoxin Q/BCP
MLKTGDQIPSFRLQNQNGEWVDSKELLGKFKLVIYFYPKDDTPGCTAEACSFRDQYADFEDVGAKLIGVSADSVASHKQFAEKHRLTFDLLSDPKNEVRQLFGVPKSFFGLLPGRVTYVFDARGRLLHSFNSQLNAKRHIEEAIQALQAS